MGEFVLYDPEEEDDKQIKAELSPGYDVMLDNIKSQYDSDQEAISDVCRLIEASLFEQIQESANKPQLHELTAGILQQLEDDNSVDINKLVEQSIHQLTQLSDA